MSLPHICDHTCKIITLKLHKFIYELIPMCGKLDGDMLLAIYQLSQVYQNITPEKISEYRFLNPLHGTSKCQEFMTNVMEKLTFGEVDDTPRGDEDENTGMDNASIQTVLDQLFNRISEVAESDTETAETAEAVSVVEPTESTENENASLDKSEDTRKNFRLIPINTLHSCSDDDASCSEYWFRVPIGLTKKQSNMLSDVLIDVFELAVATNSVLGEFLVPCTFIRISNPFHSKYNCPKKLLIEDKIIFIESFKDKYANGKENILNPEEIVIPDNHITIPFSYPLKDTFEFQFDSVDPSGFTRIELINLICDQYHKIYEIENQTATKHNYSYQVECKECKITNIDPEVYDSHIGTTDICSICHENFVKDTLKLPCNHLFHDKCINKWLERDDKERKCPMCFKKCIHIKHCGKNNCVDGVVTIEYVDIVPSIDHRRANRGLLNRSSSDGTYGIAGHDIGDLCIEQMTYYPDKKQLTMFIGS